MSQTTGHGSRAHALLSPSSSKRWINCTPSARLESFEKDSQSSAALEGTTAHEVAELVVRLHLKEISETAFEKSISEMRDNAHRLMYSDEMIEHARGYLDCIKDLITENLVGAHRCVVEAGIQMDKVTGERGRKGHVDFLAYDEETILVVDYKYGRGVKVDAPENSQMRIYALGCLHSSTHKFKKVITCIYQPRLDNISIEEISVEELKAWHKTIVIPAAKKALKGEGLQKAGDWCKFCKVAGKCASLASFSTKEALRDFDVTLLRPEQQVELFKKQKIVLDFFKALEKDMLKNMLSGQKYKGLKLVEARKNRAWVDQEAAMTLLELNGYNEEQISDRKLKAIGAIEKLVGKELFNSDLSVLTHKPKGGPVIADIKDKRADFNDVNIDFEGFGAGD